MRQAQMKHAAPLVLFFSLFFLTGIASTAIALNGTAAPDICCEQEAENKIPSNDFECTDIQCSCLSCSVSIPNLQIDFETYSPEPHTSPWMLAEGIPSNHITPIEYPPEIV